MKLIRDLLRRLLPPDDEDDDRIEFDGLVPLRLGNIRKVKGLSIADAVVIEASGTFEGIKLEYDYLSVAFGQRDQDWRLLRQSLMHDGGRTYDKMELTLSDGRAKTIYFDVTGFFDK